MRALLEDILSLKRDCAHRWLSPMTSAGAVRRFQDSHVAAVTVFNDSFSKRPYDLFGITGSTQSK